MPLLELVISATVRCGNKETYISRIMTLNERVQSELMYFIQNSLQKLEKEGEEPDIKSEVNKLRQENRHLSLHLEELHEALADSAKNQETLTQEKDTLLQRIEDSEADLLKHSHKQNKNQTAQIVGGLETQIREKNDRIQDFIAQIAEIKKNHKQELIELKDEIDLYKEQEMQFTRLESQIELYKKQVEELGVYKKKHKEITQANQELRKQINQFEDSVNDATSTKQKLNYYQGQLNSEKERSAQLCVEIEEKEKAIREMNRHSREQESKINAFKLEIEDLKNEIDRGRVDESGSCNLDTGILGSLEDHIASLEAENKFLKAQVGDSPLLKELNDQMDATLVAKKSAEEKLKAQKHTCKALAREIDSKDAALQDLRDQETELQNEVAYAKEQVQTMTNELKNFEATKIECEKLKNEKEAYMNDFKKYFAEKDTLTSKLFEAKEENLKLQNEVLQKESSTKSLEREVSKLEQLLVSAQEKEQLALQQIEALKLSEANELNVDKIKYLELQRDLLKLEGDISTLKLAQREKDDLITQLRDEKKSLENALRTEFERKEEENSAGFEEELLRINKVLEDKEMCISNLEKMKKDAEDECEKETKLMSMVIHGVGLEIMNINRTLKQDKNWMIRR